MNKVTRAVVPAAGLGTRLLPATKAMPKEMLPIVDKPAVQFIVEEAVANGIEHIVMVTGRNKTTLENHFDRVLEVEKILGEKGDLEKLKLVEQASDLADIHYVRQGDPLGLGHAVLKAESFVAGEAFAVLLADDLLEEGNQLLSEMAALAIENKANVVGLVEVLQKDVSMYGIAEYSSIRSNNTYELTAMREKPTPEQTSSRMGAVGRYVLQPEIFDILRSLKPGINGEIQLTDALNIAAKNPHIAGPVLGYSYVGNRFDIGNRLSYVQAIVLHALDRKDIGPEFSRWLSAM